MNLGTAIAPCLLALAVCTLVPRLVRAEPLPDTPGQVFAARPSWSSLPAAILEALSAKLTPASAKELADLCDRTGITENNIRPLVAKHADSPAFVVGGIATTLTSYANATGDRGDYRAAQRALMLAVTLKPRHVSAWISLAICEYQLRDCAASSEWVGTGRSACACLRRSRRKPTSMRRSTNSRSSCSRGKVSAPSSAPGTPSSFGTRARRS